MNNYRELVNKLENIDKKYTLIAEGVTLPEISTALKGYEYDEKVRFSILANIAKKNSLPGLFDPVSGKYINNEGDVDDVDNEVTKQLSALGLVPQNASLEQAGWLDSQEVRDKANTAIKGMSGQVASTQVSAADSQAKLKQLGELLAKYVEMQRKMIPQPPMMESISRRLVESFGYSIYEADTLGAAAKTAAAGYAGGKVASKMLGKAIPGVGLAFGAKDAYDRAQQGDYVGAGIAGASGLASLVPGVGTAAALGLDAANIGRDMASGAYDDQEAPAGKPSPQTGAGSSTGKANPEVLKIQKELVAKGYPLKLDGVMGPKTQAAIEYEKTNKNTNKLAGNDNKALSDMQSQINKLISDLSSSSNPDVQQLLKQATDTISSGPGAASMQPAMNALNNVASNQGASTVPKIDQNLDSSTQAGMDQQMAALMAQQEINDAAMSPARREMERKKSLDKWDTIAYGKPTGVYEDIMSIKNKLTLIENTVAEATPWGQALGSAAKYASSGFGKIKPPGGVPSIFKAPGVPSSISGGGGGLGTIGKATGGLDDAGKGLAKTGSISGEYIPGAQKSAGMKSAAGDVIDGSWQSVEKATALLGPKQLQKLSQTALKNPAMSAVEKKAIEKTGIVAWLKANPKKAAALFAAAGLMAGYGLGGSSATSGKPSGSAGSGGKKGSEALKQTQRMLNALIGANLTIDGIMGPKTQAAYDAWKAGAAKQHADIMKPLDDYNATKEPQTAMESIHRSLGILSNFK
jgi:hypothetical protein